MKKEENNRHIPGKCLACLAGIDHESEMIIWSHEHQNWLSNNKEIDLLEETGEQFERIKQSLDSVRRSQLKIYSTHLLE